MHSHTVVDHQGGWEAHDVRDRHEGDELREVYKEVWSDTGELVDEGRGHCLHGLLLLLGCLRITSRV